MAIQSNFGQRYSNGRPSRISMDGDNAAIVDCLRQRLGAESVIVDDSSIRQYGSSLLGFQRSIAAVVTPRCQAEVVAVVEAAATMHVPLYPISRGLNWGYGEAIPTADGCIIVDLSRMNRVLSVDEELGTATIEPGVSQQELYDYLRARQFDFMVPTHGGGPDCSLIGNLLERGYGITPHTDHFGALISLEVVLANGSIYRSPLNEFGGDQNGVFKWGVGPYVDGLFAQSNLGIVTRATVALARRPPLVEGVFFSFNDQSKLGNVVDAVRHLRTSLGSLLGGVNLMNRLRVLSMASKYPWHLVGDSDTIPAELLEEFGNQEGVEAWTGVGALYGSRNMIRAARKEIKRVLSKCEIRPRFLNERTANWAAKIANYLPGRRGRLVTRRLAKVRDFLQIASGKPSRLAHPLVSWRRRSATNTDTEPRQAFNKCGLIWYSPIVPMRGQSTVEYCGMVEDICRHFRIEPLITLTTLSSQAFDSTVPLLFDVTSQSEVDRAQACYRALLAAGRNVGMMPYRLNVRDMDAVVDDDSVFWSTVTKIKQALDPSHILAPGRYCPLPRREDR